MALQAAQQAAKAADKANADAQVEAAMTSEAEVASPTQARTAEASTLVAPRVKRVRFNSDIDMRTFVVGEDDVRSLTALMSAAEVTAMMANRNWYMRGAPLRD